MDRGFTVHYEIMDAIGETFGDRTVVGYADPVWCESGEGKPFLRTRVRARCKCGSLDSVPWTDLKNGRKQRCRKCGAAKREEARR